MSLLQDFREQYPQYANDDDEQLAQALHRKFYSDMDPLEFREQAGLPPIQSAAVKSPAVEIPNLVDARIQTAAESDPLADPDPMLDFVSDNARREVLGEMERNPRYQRPKDPPPARLGDQFFAGWDEYRSNRANLKTFSAAEAIGDVERYAAGQGPSTTGGTLGVSGPQISRQVTAAQALGGDPGAQATLQRSISDRRAYLVETMQEMIDKRSELTRRAQTVPFSGPTQRTVSAGSFKEGIKAFAEDPIRVMAEISVRSAPNMAEAIPLAILGGLAAGPIGFGLGMGSGSGATEYRNAFAEALQNEGVDLEDAESMIAAAEDPELMGRVRDHAMKRGAIIGAFDAVSGGLAGKTLTPMVKNVVARELANVALQTGIQATLGAGGEAGAQLATEGEIHPGEVLAEALGEGGTAVIDVGLASVTGVRAETAKRQTARVEAELTEILGDQAPGAPRETPPAEPEPDTVEPGDETITPDPDTITPEPETEAKPQYLDDRLKRAAFRDHLAGLADELVPGGSVGYIFDENEQIVGRTPSVNPAWFKNMQQFPDYRISVRQLQHAVDKAIAGKSLGVREQRVVSEMLAEVTDQRARYADQLRQELDQARLLRRQARENLDIANDEAAETYLADAAEHYAETEYDPEMSAESRVIFELMEEAETAGIAEDLLERLAIRHENNAEFIEALEGAIHEQRHQTRVASVQAEPDAGPQTRAATDPGETADIFGDDTRRAQELADEIRRRDEERNTGQDELETGDSGDLFSEAQRQIDIADVQQTRPDTQQIAPDRDQSATTTQPDRRQDTTRRARIDAMSTEEIIDELYTDALTGIANRRAFAEEQDQYPYLAAIDADSLKFINDHLSPDAGDAMLAAIGEALDQTDVDAYHLSGDEFYLGADTEEDLAGALTLAKSILAAQTINASKGSKTGIDFTYGIGRSKDLADSKLKEQKIRRETEGKRPGRGLPPPGITLSVQDAKPLDWKPGTNYVPMIGQTGALPINKNNNMIMGNGRPLRIPKTPIRREHILALMQRKFGNRIFQGRVKGKLRLGFYRPGQGEIRIKKANDIETAAHEVAHWLDDRYPWIKKLYGKHREEVLSVSYDTTKDFEGYAEFMRLYFTQEPEAMKRAPGFYDAWRKALSKYKDLEATVFDLQELMHAWTQQGARARLASKHQNTGPSFFEKVRKLYPSEGYFQNALDGLRAVKTAELDVTDGATHEAYDKLRLALGGANGVLEAAYFWGTPGWRKDGQGIEFTGDSLRAIFGEHWGTEEMAQYMIARRGQELKQQGRENLLRDDEIQAGLELAEQYGDMHLAFEKYQAFNDRILDFAQDAGILSSQTRAAIQEANKSYVPFHRVIESTIENRKVQAGGNPFMRLKGGTQNINNIWENIINNAGLVIRMSMINEGKRTLYQKIVGTKNQKGGLYAAPIGPDVKPVGIQSEQVLKKVVESLGMTWKQYRMAKQGFGSEQELALVELVDRMNAGMEEFVNFFRTGVDPTGSVDYYLDKGKKKWLEIIDPGLWDSIKFMGPKPTNWVLSVLGAFSGTLRRGVVAVPVFQVKNLARDTTNAWLLSDHVKVPAARAMRHALSRMRHDEAYWLMVVNGGGFANRSQGLTVQRKLIINPTDLSARYDTFMSRFENANRLAEFTAELDAGGTVRRAALLSREISTDFAMRGSNEIVRWLAVSVPFLNARAQGLYRVGRQFDTLEHATSYAIRGLALTGATLALYAINKDDERYKELPEDVKDLYWVFFTGPGESDYFLYPKPFESGMIWGTLPERMMEYTEERDGKEFADAVLWMIMETFHADMTPQVFQPEADLQRNKNFTGSPIVPMYLDNIEPSQQFTYYTGETAIMAGKAMGISPIKLEHRVRGYFGTLGTYALGISDALVRATAGDVTGFGEEPTRGEGWRENLLVRGLIDPLVSEGPPRRSKYVQDLYEMIRAAEKIANTTALMMKRHSDEVEAYVTDPANELEISTNVMLRDVRKEMNRLRVNMDLVRQDPETSGDAKRAALWELTRERNKLARDAVNAIEEAKQAEAETRKQNAR